MSILNKITGRQHHFRITLRYYPDPRNAATNVERRINVWMPDRSVIADSRAIKKAVAAPMFDQMPRHLKRNGNLELCEVYYLGWFKPDERRK